MPGTRKIWWVSWKGEIMHSPTPPKKRGWASTIDPLDAPPQFDPKEDLWMQMVLTPLGELKFVKLKVAEKGGWESAGVLDREEALEIARNSGDVYSVGNEDGNPATFEKWE